MFIMRHIRTAKLRDDASKLLQLHDDIAEIKSKFDAAKNLSEEQLSQKTVASILTLIDATLQLQLRDSKLLKRKFSDVERTCLG